MKQKVPSAISLEPVLNAPEVPALPDIPGGEINLLPVAVLKHDLKVTFDLWPITDPKPGYPEHLILFWNGTEVARRQWDAPIDSDDLFVMLPKHHLTEGRHVLMYRVILANVNPADSCETLVTIDKTAPVLEEGALSRLIFPGLTGPVTAQYLENNGNTLPAMVPLYETPQPGDVINFYWETAPYLEKLAGFKELTSADMSLDIAFDGDYIVACGDGQWFATYEVKDRAGNVSASSRWVELTAAVKPVPLLAPSVEKTEPLGSSSGELQPLLVTGGAVVEVPSNIDIQPGDTLLVYWDGVVPSASYQTSTPIGPAGPDRFRFDIPAGKIPGNIGRNRVVEVHYSVTRTNGKIDTSETYLLTILAIPQNRLPKLQCENASGTATLRLSAVPNGARFYIAPWVFIAAGQTMHVWIEGVKKSDGTDLYLDLFTDRQVTQAETEGRVDMLLPRSYLDQLKVNAVFWADIKVSFDGGQSFLGFERQNLMLVD